jgi:hypothetical protein
MIVAIRLSVLVLLLSLLPAWGNASSEASTTVSAERAGNQFLPVGFLLYNNGTYETCAYNQNHVFDCISGAVIGYRSSSNPALVLDANGNRLGTLLLPASDLKSR